MIVAEGHPGDSQAADDAGCPVVRSFSPWHAEPDGFQPMKANFGLLPQLTPPVRKKRERYAAYARRGLGDLQVFVEANAL